jgi:sigma-B regulation protein RsbU (phosphoserine phosphatase)
MAYLLALKGLNAKQAFNLDKERTLLGRNASCDIVFPANDFAVSREHACILRLQDKFFIEDMGSRNGTFVNNEKLTQRMQLKDNDKVRICDFLYSFHQTMPVVKQSLPGEEDLDAEGEETEALSTFEAKVSNTSHMILETKPAEKLRALVDISNDLRNTIELERLLPKIVDSLFQLFKQADRGFVILREEVVDRDKTHDRLVPKVIKTRRVQDETSASYSRSIVRECLKTVQAFLSDDASTDKRFNMAQSIADFRIRSVMCAPLYSTQENKAIGVIQLDTQDRSKKFTEDDLRLLMAVSNTASTYLDNARLHEEVVARERLGRDLELAHQVQLSFLPRTVPEIPGYTFAAHYEPAQEVGGDYYGFIPLTQPQHLAILVGDVAGKGVPAALLMAKLSSDARFSLLSQQEPGAAVSALNDLLYQNTSQMDRFVTLAAALLDSGSHTVTFVNAGHLPPLIYRQAKGGLEEVATRELVGLPLGVIEGVEYGTVQASLEPGDAVLLFSDGVTESMDTKNNQLETKALYTAAQEAGLTPQALVERIMQVVKQHASGRSQHDDITLVCFGRTSA